MHTSHNEAIARNNERARMARAFADAVDQYTESFTGDHRSLQKTQSAQCAAWAIGRELIRSLGGLLPAAV